MASYTVQKTSAVNYCGTKTTYRFGIYTATRTRWFTSVDLNGSGLVLEDIVSVKLRINVTYRVDATSYRLRSTTIYLNSWGDTLAATAGDWSGTNTNIEDDVYIGSLGWKEFDVDKNNLNLSARTWFRIACLQENRNNYYMIGLNTQNSASNKPHLRIETSDGTIYIVGLNKPLNNIENGRIN